MAIETDEEKLQRVHGDKLCGICGLPKIGAGAMHCSYPHGKIPLEPVDPAKPNGFWRWGVPETK